MKTPVGLVTAALAVATLLAASFLIATGTRGGAPAFGSSAGELEVRTVARGLVNPWALAFLPNGGVDAWASATGLATLGFILLAIDLTTTLRRMRAPGMAWRRLPVFSWAAAICSWLLLVIGPVMLWRAFTENMPSM